MTTQPTIDHIQAIDTLVFKIKPIINKADVIYLGNINNSNDSFRNLVKNAHHGTMEGSGLVWDPYWGFSNPDGSAYIDTHYNPSTEGDKYVLNDSGHCTYINDYIFTPNAWIMGSIGGGAYLGIQEYSGVQYSMFVNDTGQSNAINTRPFPNGLFYAKRNTSTSISWKNQNMVDVTRTTNSVGIPNFNIYLFKRSGTSAPSYIGGLNFTYIGASLTDAEFTTLNNAVNDYLIECLIIKYGLSNWGVQMAISYFLNLHNFEKYEAWEVYEFIKRHQSDYTYTPVELLTNSGCAGMTDWVDTNGDGVADGWAKFYGSEICSIVTGNGFTGNAQRLDASVGGTAQAIRHSAQGRLGSTYKITLKYRANNLLRIYCSASQILKDLPANIGDAIYVETIATSNYSNYFLFYLQNKNDWFEIDEVSIKEYTESDVSTFNKCTNSGFGLGTDWINPSNGLAEGWSKVGTNDASIVTGNGFIGNAQRATKNTSTGDCAIKPTVNNLEIGKSYTIYLKYRSSLELKVLRSDNVNLIVSLGTANTGDASVASATFTAVTAGVFIGSTSATVGSWIEIDEVCIIDNANIQFLYNMFGPNGLNKSIADYLMLFKTGGNLNANAWAKTGATLRWNQDGAITSSNTMPAYTRGTNLGIVTVTSTDGWDGITALITTQTNNSVNSFYGNFPLWWKIKTSGNHQFQVHQNKFKILFRNIGNYGSLQTTTSNIYSITYPGYNKININELIKTNTPRIWNAAIAGDSNSVLSGDMSLITTEFQNTQTIIAGEGSTTRQDTIIGTLNNVILTSSVNVIQIYYTGLTGGLTSHVKEIQSILFIGNRFTTSAVDSQLSVINTYFSSVTPIKNLGVNLSGTTMGIPTGGANNTDLLGIVTKHVAAGFTATITVRTS